MNDDVCGTFNINIQVKFKTTLLKSLWLQARQGDKSNKQVTWDNFAPFTDHVSVIINTQTENAKDLDVVMQVYNLIKYSDNYLKTFGSLW